MPKQIPYINQEQDRRLNEIEKNTKTINEEMGDIRISLAKVRTDVHWLKKNYFIIATASVGALIGALINLLIK